MTDTQHPDRLRVRPYALTRGRVRSATELAIESLVLITPGGEFRAEDLVHEEREIAELCTEPISIAELSANLALPIGVVRVLVGDMVTDGLLSTHRLGPRSTDPSDRPDQRLLERVLNGLQAI